MYAFNGYTQYKSNDNDINNTYPIKFLVAKLHIQYECTQWVVETHLVQIPQQLEFDAVGQQAK